MNPRSGNEGVGACLGVVFDLGDILFDATAWRRWLAEALARRGVNITYPQLVARWEALLADVYRGRACYWNRFARMLAEVGLAEPERKPLTAEARERGRAVQVGRKPFDGVPETLTALHAAGLKLAVLSDTESGEAGVRRTLAALGLERFFHAVVASNDIGHAKPEREAFAAAAAALGLELSRCAFVGHDLDELEGARAAGMTVVAYNYAPGVPADRYARHFRDLPALLADAGGSALQPPREPL